MAGTVCVLERERVCVRESVCDCLHTYLCVCVNECVRLCTHCNVLCVYTGRYGANGESDNGPARQSVHELLSLVEQERNKMSKAVLSSAGVCVCACVCACACACACL